MTWQKFSRSELQRQRYWSRSMAGWPFMRGRQHNAAHEAVAELQRQGRVELLVTQNVDRLHHRAGSYDVCELHGTIFEVECASCGRISERDALQTELLRRNPGWSAATAGGTYEEEERRQQQVFSAFKCFMIRTGSVTEITLRFDSIHLRF
jgi:NAD-dependent SIR2 family protein deacetylase